MTDLLWLPASADRFTPGREVAVDQLVFHTTTTTWASTISTFRTGSRLVSAHYVCDELLDRIARCVREEDRAWANGSWPSNQRAISIEAVDNGGYDEPRDPSLYVREAALVADIARRRPQIPLELHDDPARPGCLEHRDVVATHCPGTLDVPLIMGMARGGAGVFDPRNVQADRDWFDQRVRELVMGEEIAVYALAVALGKQVGILPKAAQKALEERRREIAARPRRTKRVRKISAAQVRAGHGRG